MAHSLVDGPLFVRSDRQIGEPPVCLSSSSALFILMVHPSGPTQIDLSPFHILFAGENCARMGRCVAKAGPQYLKIFWAIFPGDRQYLNLLYLSNLQYMAILSLN